MKSICHFCDANFLYFCIPAKINENTFEDEIDENITFDGFDDDDDDDDIDEVIHNISLTNDVKTKLVYTVTFLKKRVNIATVQDFSSSLEKRTQNTN